MSPEHRFRRQRVEEMIDLYDKLVALADLTGSQKVHDNAWHVRKLIKAELQSLASSKTKKSKAKS